MVILMKMIHHRYWLVIIPVLCAMALPFTTLAQSGDTPGPAPVVLTDSQDKYPLGLHLELLEDPTGQLTIEDVSSSAYYDQFIPSQAAVPNFGYTSAALKAGALGYLIKNSSAPELFHAIRGVAMGSLSVSPDATQVLLRDLRQSDTPPPLSPISALTERELDVLRGLAQGQSDQKLAETLNIEKTTIRSHIKSILNKLDLENRTQAALHAVELGLGRPKEM